MNVIQPRISIPHLALPKRAKDLGDGAQSARRSDGISGWGNVIADSEQVQRRRAPKSARIWRNVAPPPRIGHHETTSGISKGMKDWLQQSPDITVSKSRLGSAQRHAAPVDPATRIASQVLQD